MTATTTQPARSPGRALRGVRPWHHGWVIDAADQGPKVTTGTIPRAPTGLQAYCVFKRASLRSGTARGS